MCGICGFVSAKKINEERLEEMNNTLIHRGPDDQGLWIAESKGRYIGLAQRRLSILDLSPLGHQPMFSDDRNLVIVFNGEIYNFQTLRRQLADCGHSFKSSCDTEVLLAAYQEWGEGCLAHIKGMFAFAIYDCINNSLFLARDRIGKKPLYYYFYQKTLIFASELKALMKHPEFRKEIRIGQVSKCLCNSYIASPDTIFEHTFKLEPGCQMTWHDDELAIKRYYSYFEQFELGRGDLVTDLAQAKSELVSLIEKSVAERLVADVPVGLFLSGGIDSSLVAGIAAKVSSKKPKTFTIGFHAKERDEAPRAKAIAKHLDTEHIEFYIAESDLLDLLDDVPTYFDEPFGDSSQIPTMAVSALAKHDVTVALSGDGGDEFFCGYNRYAFMHWAQLLDMPAGLLYGAINAVGINKSPVYNALPDRARMLFHNRDADYKVQFIIEPENEIVKDILKEGHVSSKFAIEKEIHTRNWQEKRMLLDIARYLPDDILTKVDRAAMKYSLEVRCPLLDHRVSEYSFRLPHRFKYRRGERKWILKQLAYDLIPKNLLDMPKSGFSVPLAAWLRGPLKPRVAQFADKSLLEKQGIFNHEPLVSLINRVDTGDSYHYTTVLWNFLAFQMWYQKYIGDLWNA
jgi:asparagine synthase (glutamine-hydrolysing)